MPPWECGTPIAPRRCTTWRLYQAMGVYQKAEPLLQEALRIQKATLDEEHPEYAGALLGLAELCRAKGLQTMK